MKISVKQLRNLIKEVSMSPSLRKNAPLDEPSDSKNVAASLQQLEQAFSNALSLDLVVRAFDESFDPETREFDDAVYERIKSIVEDSKKRAANVVKRSLQDIWDDAHAEPASAAGVQSGTHVWSAKAA
jgi:elongation factor P hydroxylase